MFEIGIKELHQLLIDGHAASQYARDHYDQLAARQSAYTLYGASCYGLGASVPSMLTPLSARRLTEKTRRKEYIVYELDDSHKVIRTIHMLDYSKVDCTYHHFELNGVQYAYPFRGKGNGIYNNQIAALKYTEGRPFYYALISNNMLFIQFYEHLGPEKMMVSTYRYWPTAEYTQHGYPVDKNVPIGALNSCVQRHCKEEPIVSLSFSREQERDATPE